MFFICKLMFSTSMLRCARCNNFLFVSYEEIQNCVQKVQLPQRTGTTLLNVEHIISQT